jgi:hypothetical protein
VIDLDIGQVERIEADFDALPGQMGRRFKEVAVEQEGGVAAHQTVDAMQEQSAQVGGGRQLPDRFNVALPAQQRRGLQCAVLAAMVHGIEPMPKPRIQLIQREQCFGIERSQERLAHRAEETLDLAAAFGLIRRHMHPQDADGSGDAGQLRRAVDLGVIQVEARGQTARGDGLAEAVEEGIQALVGIELRMGDETHER